MIAALVLTGAPGSGKSTVLEALSSALESESIEHGAIESEELGRGFPPLADDRWIAQLAAVLAMQREAGRRLFLIVATTETEDELRGVLDAACAERTLVVCLRAPAHVLAERLELREPERWPGKRGLIAHARELGEVIPALRGIEVVIDTTGRGPEEVAAEIHEQMSRRGVIPPR
jgi:gluconate kinase